MSQRREGVAPAGKGGKDRLWGKDRKVRSDNHERIFGPDTIKKGGNCPHETWKPSPVEGFMECCGCGITRRSDDPRYFQPTS